MAKKTHAIAVIEGDGIGHEVVPEGIRVLEKAARKFNIPLSFKNFDWSCERYAKKGSMMPEDGLDTLRKFEAIYLGAVGYPGVSDHVSLWGLLVPIRRGFMQYVNFRPVRLLKGLESPLKGRGPKDIDMLIIRENVEGEYSQIGGRLYDGTPDEAAVQQAVFTRKGCDRVMKYAFEQALKRRKHVTSATKSNGISISMPYWDERFAEMSRKYPKVKTAQYHIDILTSHFVRHPDWFDVVVASNLFGDILSDLAPGVAAGVGITAGANLNPEKEYPSMFEPVHGSAPDIAGKGIANPIGQIWSGALMLDHLGYPKAHDAIVKAIETVIAETKLRTPDIGGKTKTSEMGKAIADAI